MTKTRFDADDSPAVNGDYYLSSVFAPSYSGDSALYYVEAKESTTEGCKAPYQACVTLEYDGDPETEAEDVIDAATELIESGYSPCPDCGDLVELGGLKRPKGSYVANRCEGCCNACSECGEKSWEVKSTSTSTTTATVYGCKECGNTRKGITTG